MTTAPQFVGRELGVSNWVSVDQDRIDQFAACTGDRQWIHVDVEAAPNGKARLADRSRAWLPHPCRFVAAMVTEARRDFLRMPATGLNYGLKQGPIHCTREGGQTRVRHGRASLASAEPQSGRTDAPPRLPKHAGDRRRGKARPWVAELVVHAPLAKSDASS